MIRALEILIKVYELVEESSRAVAHLLNNKAHAVDRFGPVLAPARAWAEKALETAKDPPAFLKAFMAKWASSAIKQHFASRATRVRIP
jgi:hypothetical protein